MDAFNKMVVQGTLRRDGQVTLSVRDVDVEDFGGQAVADAREEWRQMLSEVLEDDEVLESEFVPVSVETEHRTAEIRFFISKRLTK